MLPGESPSAFRVRIVRDSEGRVIGFQDPDFGNRFITRSEAINRLKYDREMGQIVDSFNSPVGVGSLAFPGRGEEVAFRTKNALYTPLGVDPTTFRPKPNQEIVERIVIIDKNGNLVRSETSYGLGNRFDPSKRGGWWRKKVSESLGLKPNERLPSADLQRAVVRRDYILKDLSD